MYNYEKEILMTRSSSRVARVLGVVLFLAAVLLPGGRSAVASDLIVYGNGLNSGWSDWSWGITSNYAVTSPVHSAPDSLAVTYTSAWGGLFLASSQVFDGSPYDTLQFWVHGGSQGGQKVRLVLADGGYNLLTDYAVDIPMTAGAWTQVKILLSDLGSPAQIGGIVLQDTSGGAQAKFYLDDITFANQGIIPPPPPPPGTGPVLSINLSAGRHAISEDIYGMNYADENLAKDLRLPVRRWGGNSTSRYNWQTNMHNVGADWYFENIPDGAPVADGSSSDLFVEQDRRTGTKTLMTMPLIGWTPSGNSPRNHPYDCGYKVSKYGTQQSTDPWDTDCGNGVFANGSNITGNAAADTSTQIGPTFVTDWINHLNAKYGSAQEGGVAYYNLDNEPMLWNSTHRDVHPQATSYDEMRDRTSQYAAAIKSADPTAQTLGPVLWGWCAYFYSALDGCGIGNDYKNHGNTPFVPWYLQQMQSYEHTHGARILDYLDLHYYPAASGVSLSSAGNSSTQALRLRSTRSLWDPSYIDESWISDTASGGVAVRLIPRMKEWVNTNYPGTKLAITEYNWGALDNINGALAQADVLGIFGREGLDLATLWGPPATTDPGAFAFRMYRNYDGAGKGFGDTSAEAVSTDQSTLSVYAAQRSSDNALTLMVINKTSGALTSTIDLAGFTPQPTASVYRYSSAHSGAIEHAPDQAVTISGFSADFPGNSITLFVLMPGTAPPPASVKVTLSPGSATVQTGKTQQFTATVTGTTNTGVTWQVNGVTGGNATTGTISGAGLYTAPNQLPNPAVVSVKAISNADSTKSASSTVTISQPPVAVTVAPASATVEVGKTQQFTANVTGTTNTAVTWQVNGVTGGNASAGTISASGLYTAPATVPNPAAVTVKAISSADPAKSATGTVTVTPTVYASVQVLSPNGGEILPSGGTFTITWDAPATATSFKLQYSLNGGNTWLAVVSSKVKGKSYQWKVPTVTAIQKACLIKIIGYDAKGRQVGTDQSDASFTISLMKITAPSAGSVLTSGRVSQIAWTTYKLNGTVSKTALSYSSDGGTTWSPIITVTGNPGSYGWTPVVGSAQTNCKIQVSLLNSKGKALANAVSDAVFSLVPGLL